MRRLLAASLLLSSGLASLSGPPGVAAASNPRAIAVFTRVFGLVSRINAVGPSLDPNFTLAAPIEGSAMAVQVWTSAGQPNAALARLSEPAGITLISRRSVLNLRQIKEIEATAMSASRAQRVFGLASRILGVGVDFRGPVRIIVDRLTRGATADIKAAFVIYGQHAVMVGAGSPPGGFTRQDDGSP